MFIKCIQFSFFLGLLASVLAIDTISKDGLFTKIGDGYYFIERNLPKNWFGAYESCRRMGAELITINTIEEWNVINKYLKNMKIEASYWTSGTDLADIGAHKWFSNGEHIIQKIWAQGQPDSYLNSEHCDALGWVPKDHPERAPALNDANCVITLLYICEASPLTAPAII